MQTPAPSACCAWSQHSYDDSSPNVGRTLQSCFCSLALRYTIRASWWETSPTTRRLCMAPPCALCRYSCNGLHRRYTCDAASARATYCCAGGMPSNNGRHRGCRPTFSESHSSILACGPSPLYLLPLAQVLFEIQLGQAIACADLCHLDNKSGATLGSLAATSLDLVQTMIYIRQLFVSTTSKMFKMFMFYSQCSYR
jgi:hypothetical protein